MTTYALDLQTPPSGSWWRSLVHADLDYVKQQEAREFASLGINATRIVRLEVAETVMERKKV